MVVLWHDSWGLVHVWLGPPRTDCPVPRRSEAPLKAALVIARSEGGEGEGMIDGVVEVEIEEE